MTAAAEAEQFRVASRAFATTAGRGWAIEKMMRLALQGVSPVIRRWAAVWLLETINVHVVTEDQEGGDNAASTPAASLPR